MNKKCNNNEVLVF